MQLSKATIKELKLFIKQRGAPKAKSIEVRALGDDLKRFSAKDGLVVVFRICMFFFKRTKKGSRKNWRKWYKDKNSRASWGILKNFTQF